MGKDFKLDIIAAGDFDDYERTVSTITFRVNPPAMDAWIFATELISREFFRSKQDWDAYCESKKEKMAVWQKEILTLFDQDFGLVQDVKITHVTEQVFILTYARPLTKEAPCQ